MNSHNYDELAIVNMICPHFMAFINYITKINYLLMEQNSHFRNRPF